MLRNIKSILCNVCTGITIITLFAVMHRVTIIQMVLNLNIQYRKNITLKTRDGTVKDFRKRLKTVPKLVNQCLLKDYYMDGMLCVL